MESNSLTLFGEGVLDLKSSRHVVPNRDSFVLGTCNDQLFADTHIKTGDLILVEHALHVVKNTFEFLCCGVKINITRNDLSLVCDHGNLLLM